MFSSKFLVCAAALLAAAASRVDAGSLPSGVCYSPWHHDSVSADVVGKDLSQVKQYFSGVRTYHASFAGVNVVDSAVAAGLQVAVGIQMGDKNGIAGEIAAACDGAKRNPSAVRAIYVGNENLKNGDFGTFSADELVTYINQIKGCTAGLNIKVGSVQRINEWLSADGAATLAGASDIIGVNIYPFFTSGDQAPIEKLKAQWAQMTAKYSEDKLALTETGWPRQGATVSGNAPSKETLQQFLDDFATWSQDHTRSYFFMMYDTKVSYTGADYEKYFGLADTSGVLQVQIPSGSGSSSDGSAQTTPAPAMTTAAPATDAPAATPDSPATDAPSTPATPDSPTTDAPSTPATPDSPTTDAPSTPATPDSPATGAPATPGQTSDDNDDDDANDSTANDANVPAPVPAPTPASSKIGGKKPKKVICDA